MDNPWSLPTNWIWVKNWSIKDESDPKIVYFRKNFNFEKKPEKALIKVSADSRYRLYVNGQSVCFGPCKGDGFVWYYEEIDIAPYLQKGENVLAAVVLRYPPVHGKGNHSVWRTNVPNFYLVGSARIDDAEIELSTDSSWKCKVNEEILITEESSYSKYLWNAEKVTGSYCLQNWYKIKFNDKNWEEAVQYISGQVAKGVSPQTLSKRSIPFLYEVDRQFQNTICIRQSLFSKQDWNGLLSGNNNIEIPPYTKEVVELDAGELTTGFLQLYLAAGKYADIRILTSEAYWIPAEGTDNTVRYKKENREDYVNGKLIGNEDTYVAAGIGSINNPEYYEPFWFKTFRFIQLNIETKEEPLLLQNISYRETGYPLEVKTQVETSDNSLKDIWDISLRTLKRCMHETYEDCPFYEQLQYAMDTRSQILFTYAVSGDDRLARKCIDDFHRSLRPEGMINCCYPSFGPNIIPGFALYYIFMIHDHMMYFGDRQFIRKYFSTVDKILSFFDSNINEQGLVKKIGEPNGRSAYWSFVDWTKEWSETWGVPKATLKGPITMESLLYITALEKAAEMAEYIGRESIGEEYKTRGENVKSAVNRFCKGKNGLYQDGPGIDEYSQHCQVWAVLSETASMDEYRDLMKKTMENKELAQCSVAMQYYLFRALEKSGLYEMTKELWKIWKDMIEKNLTTCVEDPVNGRSDCHAWGSLILYEIPQVVLGVRPATPGFKKLSVSPVPGYLEWAKGEVITPKGIVKVSWIKTDIGIEVKIDGSNCDCEIEVKN